MNDPVNDPAADAVSAAEDAPAPRRFRPQRGFGRGAIANRARLSLNLPVAIAAMAALALGLIVWRVEIVRLLPQTASFFKLVGVPVNLRNLQFENVTVSSESVNGTPVLVIDGFVASTAKKPVEIPRLRLVVHDTQGAAVYGWNALLEQAVLQPGEKAPFKTRLASPPSNAHDVVVRFFTKRDLTAGGA
jgi:hypothetical protein